MTSYELIFGSVAQLVGQRLRLFEVLRVQTFSEPALAPHVFTVYSSSEEGCSAARQKMR